MITKDNNSFKNCQVQMVSIDQLVPENHILRKIDKYIDFTFIYDLVEDKYSPDQGRPSIDPVVLIKIALIQFLFGIPSMRQTIEQIEVNMAYRWFLGLGFYDSVPHFSTFGKNYKRRFEGTDLFEQIFMNILMQCMNSDAVDTSTIFVDSTHIKAAANKRKFKKIQVAKKATRFYDEELRAEIDKDREDHSKKPLKDNGNDDDTPSGDTSSELKEQKQSTIDPESGWFHKGDHKEVFAYSAQTGCDKNGWILGYTIHKGNESDKVTFKPAYDKLKEFNPDTMVMDAAYKTPPIAKMLMDDGIEPILPYTRGHTKKGYMKKREYIYDEYYDCYICPAGNTLEYSTTNREGYRMYKSDRRNCECCEFREQCTKSANHVKVITRHIWQDYLDECEEIRYTERGKRLYALRKETIERVFGTAKERHGMRYTQDIGKEKMAMKVGLTFACMNMKKLANLLWIRDGRPSLKSGISNSIGDISAFSIKTVGA